MGLIRAAVQSAASVMADQWEEYFYCDSIPANILAIKGSKKTSRRGSNKKGSENVISNGSVIAVNEGQCMMIVDQGKVVDVCAQPGEYIYDASSEPSIFYGDLGENVRRSFETFGIRFAFGGEAPKDQRVYFFNTKEIVGNKYGTANPVPFRVVDRNIGLDIDIAIRCHGEYSYRMVDPICFYVNVCGNVEGAYSRENLDSQLKSELMTALQPAFARISEQGIRYSALPGHTAELAEALNQELSAKWSRLRGIEIVSLGVSGVKASEEDEQMIKELQRSAAFMDPTRAAAHLVGAQASAMQAAASNTAAGPAMAFMGMNQAAAAGGVNARDLYQMGGQQTAAQPQAAPAAGWTCSCGHTGNTGKFCAECGKPRPEAPAVWVCSCGAKNSGKFCSECGKPRPAARCANCGFVPADPANPPKFCPECGKPFGA